MTVLFITDELFPSTSANSRIVFRIIDQLLKFPNLRIDILGQARHESQRGKEYHGCKIIHTPYYRIEKHKALNKKLGRFKQLRFLFYPRTIAYRIARKRGINNPYIWEAKRWLKKHCFNYDVVVAMSMPYYNLDIAVSIGNRIPVILYPLEPIAAFDKSADDYEKRLDYEISLENKATKLVFTSLIHKDFLSDRTRVNEHKVIEAEFPCIFNRPDSFKTEIENTDNRISLVFVGKFYAGYREPDFLCKLMDYLPQDAYKLTIVGGLNTSDYKPEIINTYLSNTHSSIYCTGFVLQDNADAYLLESDILVHVGNKQSNIMPSKILDYVSTGKPIVNICKTHNCPTIPIMEKYPLGLVIFEDEGLNETVVARIDKFCKNVKGQRTPFETIQRLYYKYTPEYVGNVFHKAILDSINEFKTCVE